MSKFTKEMVDDYADKLLIGLTPEENKMVLDEFDINLHPDILPHLINLFITKELNPNKAQMIFSTLNPDVLDVLGKYRSYLFEKENGESFGYRLDESDTNILRNDRSVSAPYKRHLLGGYPKIEA